MKKIILLVTLVSASFWACSDFKVTTTDEGDRIQYHTKGDGKVGKEGDIIIADVWIKDANDTTYRNSFKEGEPIKLNLAKGPFVGSFENALFHLSKGDSATVYVKADSLFGKMQQPLPMGLAPGSDMKFIVAVRNVLTPEENVKLENEKLAKQGEEIKAWVAKNLPNATQLDTTGIYFAKLKEGSGASPVLGQQVKVLYQGRFFNGTPFDGTEPGADPIEFTVGTVVPGWNIMLQKMKAGDKVTCVIPSQLGYGEQGGGPIPPNSPLVFDIELVSFK